jgi:diguanylate cyclase (GGDEF)-like protein
MTDVMPRETAGITTRLIVAYIRRRHGEPGVARLLELSGETRPVAELEDERSWSSYDQKVALFEAAEQVTGDEWVARRIGESVLEAQIAPSVRRLIVMLGSPQQVLRACARANAKFTTNSTMLALEARRGHAVVTSRLDEGYTPSRHDCRYTQGILTQASVLFGLPAATIVHPRCQVDGASACVYEVTWQKPRRWLGRLARRGQDTHREVEAQALREQVTDLQHTVSDLVSAADLDEVLGRIASRASAAVRGQRYLLAVRLRDDEPARIHSDGLTPAEADRLGAELLAGEDGALEGADHLVAEVATARQRYGWLTTYLPRGKGFLPGEDEQLAAYGRLAGAALDATTALAEARRSATVARALLQLATDLAHLGETWSIADRVTRAVPEVMGSARASMLAWDEEHQRLVTVAVHGYGAHHDAARDIEVGRGDTPLLDELVESLRPRVLHHPVEDLPVREAMERLGAGRVAFAPVTTHDRFLGAVMVTWAHGTGPTDDEDALLWSLAALADQTGTAMANVELLKTAQHQARHDPLTGLANRLLLRERIELALADQRRSGELVAVCFLDLDDFKPVNDRLGHAAGDRVLIEVARRLRERVRETDVVARVSGDEFVILLRGMDELEGAQLVASDVVEALEKPYLSDVIQEVRLSVSVGIAVAPEHGEHPDALLRAADIAMYAAKRERGTYRVYEPGLGKGLVEGPGLPGGRSAGGTG